MAVFADTSGFFPLVATDDGNYRRAQAAWEAALSGSETLISHSYVISESFALVQRRLGMEAVALLQDRILRRVEIVWVDAELHNAGVKALIAGQNRRISLVDYVSFEIMHQRGIDTAFKFDDDFARAGFHLLR